MPRAFQISLPRLQPSEVCGRIRVWLGNLIGIQEADATVLTGGSLSLLSSSLVAQQFGLSVAY